MTLSVSRRQAAWTQQAARKRRMGYAVALAAVLACAGAMAPAALADDPQAGPQAQPASATPAQTVRDGAAFAKGYNPPRTSWGKPNLEGNWSNATVSRMDRPAGYPLIITAEQAAKLEGGALINVRNSQKDAAYVDPKAGAPEKGKPLPPVGNYDVAYTDPGNKVTNIKGELRSSWITYPADGKIPALTENGKTLRKTGMAGGRRGTGYDNPEERGLSERCIIIGNAGPPLGTYLYNNNFQIVQTPDYVVLESEMIHDVRTIHINGKLGPDNGVEPYHGDSVAHWDGDTLVVETTHMNPAQRAGRVFLSKDGKVIERLTRISDTQILYEFEIDDPAVYTSVWKGQMALTKINTPLYEYACNEGNYALPGILSGGRSDDKKGITHRTGGPRGE
jgi:hypothetical protein